MFWSKAIAAVAASVSDILDRFMVLLVCCRWRCCAWTATVCIVMTNCSSFSLGFPNLVHKPADPWRVKLSWQVTIEPRDCSWTSNQACNSQRSWQSVNEPSLCSPAVVLQYAELADCGRAAKLIDNNGADIITVIETWNCSETQPCFYSLYAFFWFCKMKCRTLPKLHWNQGRLGILISP